MTSVRRMVSQKSGASANGEVEQVCSSWRSGRLMRKLASRGFMENWNGSMQVASTDDRKCSGQNLGPSSDNAAPVAEVAMLQLDGEELARLDGNAQARHSREVGLFPALRI
eukprot:CAMPEP_0175904196 /NCGR_PEP_ID=MMETSP0108-20121206/4340_1 /TAXON_ID=195067 ORGANISM="Goniomonas pacifica, Strain CCMP1869" /NCGR_SAMPLE_ID=MMETSP0108 /ASSEMBLY_ACC=CAM_ASM_000204 /LENGTH=110 /DNA_ID=CAMNT_0017225977 /DNA_START=59 /DNA_END=390 /DNA_ORIENTATION=-